MTLWAVMWVGGGLTLLIRLSFIAVEGKIVFPEWFRSMLPYVPIATLSALIAPELVRSGGTWHVSMANPRLVAGCAAIALAAATRNVLLTIVGGFLVFVLMLWLA
jgi:branched-subunit amino acid transport protein